MNEIFLDASSLDILLLTQLITDEEGAVEKYLLQCNEAGVAPSQIEAIGAILTTIREQKVRIAIYEEGVVALEAQKSIFVELSSEMNIELEHAEIPGMTKVVIQ